MADTEPAQAGTRASPLRTAANIAAGVTVLLVLGVGVIWVVPAPSNPSTAGQTVTDTTKTTTGPQGTAVEQTHVTTTSAPSIWERYLAEGRLEIVVRLAFILLAAFLAAAMVQKVVLGQYAITLPFVTIPGISEAVASSAKGLDDLQKTVSKQSDDVKYALREAASALEASAQALRQVKELRRRVRRKAPGAKI